MKTTALLLAALSAVSGAPSPQPQGVTAQISPQEPTPDSCRISYPRSFGLSISGGGALHKRDVTQIADGQIQAAGVIPSEAAGVLAAGESAANCAGASAAGFGQVAAPAGFGQAATPAGFSEAAAPAAVINSNVNCNGQLQPGEAGVLGVNQPAGEAPVAAENAGGLCGGQLQAAGAGIAGEFGVASAAGGINQIADGQIQAPANLRKRQPFAPGGAVYQIADGQIQVQPNVAAEAFQSYNAAPVPVSNVVSGLSGVYGAVPCPAPEFVRTTSTTRYSSFLRPIEHFASFSAPLSPVEPCPAPAPVEPYAVPSPVEPCAVPAPIEPCAVPAPVEPYAVPAPVEPCAVPAPVEPYAVPAPVEPCAVPAPVEPYAIPAPVEPYAVPAPVEPCAVPAPVEPYSAPFQPAAPYVNTAGAVTQIFDGQIQAPANFGAAGPALGVSEIGLARQHRKRQNGLPLSCTLKNGVLTDDKGRTGYIADNRQFQFDAPPQSGAIYTSGFSACDDGTLALGGSNTFYACGSSDFNNLYDEAIFPDNCQPVKIHLV